MTFDEWKLDLEERLAYHLFYSPETPAPKIIKVVEDEDEPGTWEIFVNGEKKYSFEGFGAHRRASARAGELANE